MQANDSVDHAQTSREFEQAVELGYRMGFGRLCVILAALGIVQLLGFILTDLNALEPLTDDGSPAIRLLAFITGILVIGYYLVRRRRRLRTRESICSAIVLMITMIGGLLLASRAFVQRDVLTNAPDGAEAAAAYGLYFLWGGLDVLVLHAAAAATVPWSPKDALRSGVWLLLGFDFAILILESSPFDITTRAVIVILSPVLLAPGALIAFLRYQRLRERFDFEMLGRQVETTRDNITRARIVHDAMFPDTHDDGYVTFQYIYNPIAEMGGDYVHFHFSPTTHRVSMTLLDVAGHGLAAALTVNRLFGELERIWAEAPDAEPCEVMELLNRYIFLTMAKHDLYATGACLSLDPHTGRLLWCNAGHPPVLLRRASGEVEDLIATTVLLGALSPRDFEPEQTSVLMSPGDVAIAYTDGAFEARNQDGRQFGLKTLRATACFHPPPRDWTRFISTAVAKHHEGCADDDVLIAALCLNGLRIDAPDPIASAATPARASR